VKDYLVTIKVEALDYRGTFFVANRDSVAEAKGVALTRATLQDDHRVAGHLIEYDVRVVWPPAAAVVGAALALALALTCVAPADAQVRYVDEQGGTHWAQSADLVPEKYRAAATRPTLPSVSYKGEQGGAFVPGGGSYGGSSGGSRGGSGAFSPGGYSQSAPAAASSPKATPQSIQGPSIERGIGSKDNPEGVGGHKYGAASK